MELLRAILFTLLATERLGMNFLLVADGSGYRGRERLWRHLWARRG